MTRLTMKERRSLLCHHLQKLADGIDNYSISDWAVNHLLLELIKLGYQDQSVFEVVNNVEQDDKLLPLKDIEEELEQEKVFT